MIIFSCARAAIPLAIALTSIAAQAETAREALTTAGFADRDKATALARVDRVRQVTDAALARSPGDQEAAMVGATADGYRAKLTGNRAAAIEARRKFEGLVAKYPGSAEAYIALGAWHVGVIASFGRFVGRAAVGAKKDVGFASIDRAVKLGGNRAMFLGLAALLRLELDPDDAQGRRLAEAAARAAAPTQLDRIMQRSAAAVLVPLRQGDGKAAQKLADRLLPFGQIRK